MTATTSTTASARTLPAARVVDAVKVYGSGDTGVRALDGVSVDFPAGRFTAIMGPSGSGKSTLMHCAAGLDTLTEGTSCIGGTDLGSLDDRRLTLLRRDRVGSVFWPLSPPPQASRAASGSRPVSRACSRRSDFLSPRATW
jgi:putative ABC transport system ATP-binding protein